MFLNILKIFCEYCLKFQGQKNEPLINPQGKYTPNKQKTTPTRQAHFCKNLRPKYCKNMTKSRRIAPRTKLRRPFKKIIPLRKENNRRLELQKKLRQKQARRRRIIPAEFSWSNLNSKFEKIVKLASQRLLWSSDELVQALQHDFPGITRESLMQNGSPFYRRNAGFGLHNKYSLVPKYFEWTKQTPMPWLERNLIRLGNEQELWTDEEFWKRILSEGWCTSENIHIVWEHMHQIIRQFFHTRIPIHTEIDTFNPWSRQEFDLRFDKWRNAHPKASNKEINEHIDELLKGTQKIYSHLPRQYKLWDVYLDWRNIKKTSWLYQRILEEKEIGRFRGVPDKEYDIDDGEFYDDEEDLWLGDVIESQDPEVKDLITISFQGKSLQYADNSIEDCIEHLADSHMDKFQSADNPMWQWFLKKASTSATERKRLLNSIRKDKMDQLWDMYYHDAILFNVRHGRLVDEFKDCQRRMEAQKLGWRPLGNDNGRTVLWPHDRKKLYARHIREMNALNNL